MLKLLTFLAANISMKANAASSSPKNGAWWSSQNCPSPNIKAFDSPRQRSLTIINLQVAGSRGNRPCHKKHSIGFANTGFRAKLMSASQKG